MESLLTVVIETVARHYGTDPASIMSHRKYKSMVHQRHVALYVAHLVGDFSYLQIAEAFGRDHSSVIHACQGMARKTAQDPKLNQTVNDLVLEVQGLGLTGGKVKIRPELLTLIEKRLKVGIYGRTVEDIVDRILCEHFQRELNQ